MPGASSPKRWTPEFYAQAAAPEPPSPDPPDPSVPYWIPPGVDLADMPAELKAALAGVINPAYRELVLEAKPGLPQSTGLSIVHLLWMEVLDQLELAEPPPDLNLDPLAALRDNRATTIARHLRLVGAKLKASELLLRLDQFKFACQRLKPEAPDREAILAQIFPGHCDQRLPEHGKQGFG